MSSSRGKPVSAPRTINVQKFAETRTAELESLHTIVSNRLDNNFKSQRNSRRRTTAHNDKLGKKKRKRNSGIADEDDEKKNKKLSRRVRRRMEFKDGVLDGFTTSGDGIRRLKTHVWHAKRFEMSKIWGWNIPLGLLGKGRGCRGVLKWYENGVIVHDASYFTCVELEGLEVEILTVLENVLLRTSVIECEGVLLGSKCGKGILHQVGLSTRAICPVTYMWRPVQSEKIQLYERCDHKEFGHSSHRQLWMWLHASAFDEGFEAVKLACSKIMSETGQGITLSSLDGKVTKFQVMGSKAWQLIRKVFLIVGSDDRRESNDDSVLKPHSEPRQVKYLKLESEDKSVTRSIFYLTVNDPRDVSVENKETASEGELVVSSLSVTPNVVDDANVLDDSDKIKMSSLKLASRNFKDESLWNIKNGVCPPVDEQSLSVEKHNLRLQSYSIPDQSSKATVPFPKLKLSRSCPIILIKDADNKGICPGYTIILPVCWAKTFWMPLILNGAHAIGLREKHWIASNLGVPYFPSDFPDCNAYMSYKANEAAKFDNEADRRPPSVKPIRVPIFSPWNCVKLSLDSCLSRKPDSIASGSIQHDQDAAGFSGTVTRTASQLAAFADQICGGNLPLFPFSANKKRLTEWVQNETIDPTRAISQQKTDQTLNFVRVTLQAYREGVFEEGAVVCAPSADDIQSWKSSLDGDEHRLQTLQSSVSTYFIEQSHGKWELQIPEDPALLHTYRWPIGFITSGFVRGSKKASACSFCDVTLLGHIRQEQWRNIPSKKRKNHIYVLVRNLRSNTYRLAIARIVLEHQEADTTLM